MRSATSAAGTADAATSATDPGAVAPVASADPLDPTASADLANPADPTTTLDTPLTPDTLVEAPAENLDLVVPEQLGDIVSPAPVKFTKTQMWVPVTMPSAQAIGSTASSRSPDRMCRSSQRRLSAFTTSIASGRSFWLIAMIADCPP